MHASTLTLDNGGVDQFELVTGIVLKLHIQNLVRSKNILNDILVDTHASECFSRWNQFASELTILVEEKSGAVSVLEVFDCV